LGWQSQATASRRVKSLVLGIRSQWTLYLTNGGTAEKAAQVANHASTRRTQHCDRWRAELSLDDGE